MPKKLVRDTRHGVIAGVAAGWGRYLDVDPVLVRLAFILLSLAHGLGLLAYLICWVIVPRAEGALPEAAPGAGFESLGEAGARIAAEVRSSLPATGQAQAVVGSLLVVGGALLLARNLGLFHWPHWLRFDTLWPLLLVALGLGLIFKSRSPTTA
jgi:phage shock protein C